MDVCYYEEKEAPLCIRMGVKLAANGFKLGFMPECGRNRSLLAKVASAFALMIAGYVIGFVAGSALSLAGNCVCAASSKVYQVARGVFARAA